MIKCKKSGKPFFNIWFGNFYEPAFSDKKFIENAIEEIKEMGFNSVMLDSKSWADFFDRYAGKSPSQYVEMQEYMMKVIKEKGLSHNFLAIYLNGDNLYPEIRFSPPVLGESIVGIDGKKERWYKYWSCKAHKVMEEHVKGLLKLYSDNHTILEVNEEEKIPLCSMWDPVVAPSFDDEGISRYQNWLKTKYKGNIEVLNQAYNTNFISFEEISPYDYWFELKFKERKLTENDILLLTPAFRIFVDNMLWRLQELKEYFMIMQKRFKEYDSRLFLIPNLSQWNILFNYTENTDEISFGDLWDTAYRGLDPYEIKDFVDICTFTTVPVDPVGETEPYVVSCQANMIRCMNENRDFIVGLFIGRYIYNDIYRYITPAEMIGSIVGSGAKGYFVYGYCGLDDGGLLHKMGENIKASIKVGNQWAAEVIPRLKNRVKSQVAILYPSAMALLEPLSIENNKERRMDFLGWYKSLCDAGYMVDIIHLNQIEKGALDNYKILILPANICYKADRRALAEEKIREWVERGGIIIHGPHDMLVECIFGFKGKPHTKDCVIYKEGIVPVSIRYKYFEGEEIIAAYDSDRKGCIVRNRFGEGFIYSFGFDYGYSYISKKILGIPREKGNREFYPVPYVSDDPFKRIVSFHLKPASESVTGKDIECCLFENGIVIINHSNFPLNVSPFEGQKIFQIKVNDDVLIPHSAVCIITH
ncbi:hypothetical protein Csac_2723 [Caldicellulosiruptor saccharolyticus DSM 8903]|uniref:Beta-galactosidase trimerisation domain-containing protein n=1 Tax=Caldicellulosiruptor saccharolyticus (strain ATCC 43494 / DSM 8903 / Tp8T 6331) TaxID=351627 RepID=A4XN06_CALS8|nr:alpha-amylase family protein [Caldicellulosiruptor saccharolyticus]ABP68291.1 hypothetical protein Csac_2723 [Caldicellulosiruptor saccharolyticus DSM 8903]